MPSTFLTASLLTRLQRNLQTDPWCAAGARELIVRAAPWHARSDAELWELMFGPTITRSWMVINNGFCPTCRGLTPGTNWIADPQRVPWKVACPHCGDLFPKNDFHAYYRSGLDRQGVFDPQLADRSLLGTGFGVDDGEGYCEGERRWRFIGTYLLQGIWKKEILAGIEVLSTAYVLTGDGSYARQAAVLLDRVADLHPLFDFATQGVIYGAGQRSNGAVDNWHAANVDVLGMAFAYDRIRPALPGDAVLVEFLSRQARRYELANPKTSWADIQRNIETRIFREALHVHPERFVSNAPRGEILRAVLTEILGEPGAEEMLDVMVANAVRVDGVTGEKGLASYCFYVIAALAEYLALLSRRDPGLLPALLKRHPRLRETYRFHVETRCLNRYYPNIGDAGGFAMPVTTFGVFFSEEPSLRPSAYSFMADLYRVTGEPVYLQMLNVAAREKLVPAWPHTEALARLPVESAGLPFDLFAEDPAAFRRELAERLAEVGTELPVKSVDKKEWCVAILQSGKGEHARAVWLDYDIGGSHSHADGMNLGLFAHGLDLLPDAGYPQNQFTVSDPAKTRWFITTAAHNTVVVDGRDQGHYYQSPARGRTTLWADGPVLQAVRAEFGAWPEPLPAVREEPVALYAYTTGRFRAVRIWTDDGTLALADDFQREALGPDWAIAEGEWRVESGWAVGRGKLVCTRQFRGPLRLDYEAQAASEQPCDLSAYVNGIFFGFGSENNQGSKLIVRANIPVAARSDRRILPGQTHQVSCRCAPQHLQMRVDGMLALDCPHLTNLTTRLVFGDDEAPKQFERTVALIDVSPTAAYVVDVFRVVGGREHVRFFHGTFGSVQTTGLTLRPGAGFGAEVLLRNIQTDPRAPVGWQATWQVRDHYRLLPAGRVVQMRQTDLTRDAEATVAEMWVNAGNLITMDEQWIPALVTRRRGPAPLATTFVAVIEPFATAPAIASIRRLEAVEPAVLLEITLADGSRDVVSCGPSEVTLTRGPTVYRAQNIHRT
ncbi:MAG: hypothetical protein PCFJNLEI_00938 [Verrucomicrobiae bacterium]|nr:hypothetical protein [Verrucomicrobiae bacterium]